MKKQIFRLAQSDELVFYARSSGGKMLTRYIHESGFNSFDQVADVLMSMIPQWYDEGLVCMQITCEAKGLTKNINKRISKR